MHRAEQILQAAVSAIADETDLAASVYGHRYLSLSPDDQELPAICVNDGPDQPVAESGYSNLAYVDSQLRLDISIYAQGDTQQAVADELYRLRSVVHRAMLVSPRDLGLSSFVMGIGYGGADKPDYTTDGSPLAGRMDCSFVVLYRMDLTSPG